jgi:hypothetical protein
MRRVNQESLSDFFEAVATRYSEPLYTAPRYVVGSSHCVIQVKCTIADAGVKKNAIALRPFISAKNGSRLIWTAV